MSVNHGAKGPYFGIFLDPEKGWNRSNSQFLTIFTKEVFTMWQWNLVYSYFQVYIYISWPHGAIFLGLFHMERAKINQNSGFDHFLKVCLLCDHETWFRGILEVSSAVCKSCPQGALFSGPLASKKGNNISKFRFSSIFQTVSIGLTWNLFLKAYWNYFPLEVPGGLQRALGAQILSGIWYMLAKTELISTVI